MYETHKDVKLAHEGLMRLASGGLCPLSTPWWRDSLLVGAKEGRGEREQEKKKKGMNYFLSIYSVARSIIWGVLFRGAGLPRGRGAEAWSSPLSLFFAGNRGSSTAAGEPSHQEASF